MLDVKERFLIFSILVAITLLPLSLYAEGQPGHKSKSGENASSVSGNERSPVYPSMPGPGKKVPIGNNYYFIYGFDKQPQMGTVIMRVEVYTMNGKKETSLEIKGDTGMPSMRGAHETGDRPFKLSKNGVYLLPVDIVMPGDWEIRLTFLKDGKVIFRGSHQFDV